MTLRSATLKSAALAAFAALALASCQTASAPARAANGDVAALQVQTGTFARDTAIAAFYAQQCAGEGVSLVGGSPEAASQAFFARMTEAGYSTAQIEAATGAVDTAATGQAAIAYLEGRGLEPGGGNEALCTSARREIADGTPVGRLLTL